MWYPAKIHSHPDLTLCRFWTTYQISGRNFFQVGDDVTTRNSKVYRVISCGTCCLEGWSGHGSRNKESSYKLNGLCTHGLRNT
ncbi:hypothetical protein HanXRQr2_Chr07g0298811 [Helianthus annuus]|uniref:Uncharacterized protein n=1 Tax=Helianthus annuus TaxID=4232 RepID=A0A9K3NGI5_HELAN|nr:hypothetical protein HanXRQr2_Chr07g0298811 [Helianthus annuus]KAJ0905034.1 hypothetical protein HanPSC8_Chr07g0289321 [Helianthus annuus]